MNVNDVYDVYLSGLESLLLRLKFEKERKEKSLILLSTEILEVEQKIKESEKIKILLNQLNPDSDNV